MENNPSDIAIPSIAENLDSYESKCLSLLAQACKDVRRHLSSKPDIEGSITGSSFAYVAGGWVRDKVVTS